MKRLIVAFFFILPFFAQAQIFHFNILTKYKTTFDGKTRESIVYSNSKNDTYFLMLYNDSEARLYDAKHMKVYNYEVLETKLNNEVFFDFKYKNSRRLNSNKSRFSNYEYEFKTSTKDTLKPQITITVFEDSKRKNSVLKLNCIAVKKAENLFHLFKFSCLHPFEFENVIPNGNYLVESATGLTSDNKRTEYKLMELKEVNFKLEIK